VIRNQVSRNAPSTHLFDNVVPGELLAIEHLGQALWHKIIGQTQQRGIQVQPPKSMADEGCRSLHIVSFGNIVQAPVTPESGRLDQKISILGAGKQDLDHWQIPLEPILLGNGQHERRVSVMILRAYGMSRLNQGLDQFRIAMAASGQMEGRELIRTTLVQVAMFLFQASQNLFLSGPSLVMGISMEIP